jgi:GntR family transcriptional regulator
MSMVLRQQERPGFRPLYQQVRELLLARIAAGVWRPAESLPGEQTLAEELGVSHGTVRKALDSLEAENLIERRQGKGTFVVEHTQESAHFRFFRISHENGERALPTCRKSTVALRKARPQESRALNLATGAEVYQIRRDRYIDAKPAVRELIVVPAALFPGLMDRAPLPNTLYTLYQSDFGVSIASAAEQVKAVAAGKSDAVALGLTLNAPIIEVNRIAYDISGRAAEFRQSRFSTEDLVYSVELR